MALHPFSDYIETEHKIRVRFEIPDMLKDHIAIRVTKDTLKVQLDKSNHSELLKNGYMHEEQSFAAISKEILLPTKVNPKKTKTSYKNGIFEVILVKK